MSGMPPVSPLLLRRVLALEVPDCACPRVVVRACERAGRACEGECDCPAVPGVPCEHVFHADDVFFSDPHFSELIDDGGAGPMLELLRRWAARLLAADPGEYAEPPVPASVMVSPEAAVRVAVMAARWGDDPQRPRHGIRHPRDDGKGDNDRVAVVRERAMNGSDHEIGLYDPDAVEAPGLWDEWSAGWLERVNAVAGRVTVKRTLKLKRAA